ncbi:MAG: GIY-YIG nuclease family protein [Chloroflexi bacterium]|nr:GIY-YIG nuclease family protein [Chloroflexota bacterium]
MRDYFLYIMSNRTKTLYAGVTNNLERRVAKHNQETVGFTRRYKITKLVYYEVSSRRYLK